MHNRRDFLRAVAGAAAGAAVTGGLAHGAGSWLAPQATSPRRREVSVGGRRARVIDMHAHCFMPEVAELVKGTRLNPSMNDRGLVLGPERLRAMDERGIDLQVLSNHNFWFYPAERDLAARIVELQDEKLSQWCAAHPDRFVGLASIALQHPDLAAKQLERGVTQLGLRGATVAGDVEGEPLSARKFDPFWAKAAELGVPVFMHPQSAKYLIRDGALDGNGDLTNVIGNPLETTAFLTRLILDGTFDRFPGLRVCASHAGGYLPSYLGRTEVACQVRPTANCANKKPPSEYLKREILVDSMIFSEEGLRHLATQVGAGQIVYGTDMPYNWPDSLNMILGAPFLTDADKHAIVGGNLAKLLRI